LSYHRWESLFLQDGVFVTTSTIFGFIIALFELCRRYPKLYDNQVKVTMEKTGSIMAVNNMLERMGLRTYVGNCVGNKEKGSQMKSSETLVFTGAPLNAQSCNWMTSFQYV